MPRPALAAIFNPAGHPVTPQPVSTPKKRKADGELPIRDKTACHAQAQQRRERSAYNALDLQGTLGLLGKLRDMSKTWEDQYRMLLIFLNSSSSPPQPTPSCATPPWSSPGLAPLPVPSSDDDILECRFPLDTTIPCSYQEEALSSSLLEPSLDPIPSSVQSSSLHTSSDPVGRTRELV